MMLIYTENRERSAAIHNLDTGITYVLRAEKVIGDVPDIGLVVSSYPPGAPVLGMGNILFGGAQAEAFWRRLVFEVGFPTDETSITGALWFINKLAGRPVAAVRPGNMEE